ncbi:MAG: dTDP-4-dehydrorhamnose 3,5-epimerase [Myxococcales bacterium]|nr:dTDP-4-dehydrorhamnose 3,5-epimerase [Myxococcales bacterium]
MKLHDVGLDPVKLIELELREDDRGWFARAFCAQELEAQGLPARFVQANMSGNKRKGTLRGLHYQVPPAAEAKLVRCVRGAVFDVAVDVRQDSPTFGRWFGAELSADNRRAMFVPESFAHGYLALTDGAEVLYQVSAFYTPGAERGFRYDDPFFGITWPIPVEVLSEKDASWPPHEVNGR